MFRSVGFMTRTLPAPFVTQARQFVDGFHIRSRFPKVSPPALGLGIPQAHTTQKRHFQSRPPSQPLDVVMEAFQPNFTKLRFEHRQDLPFVVVYRETLLGPHGEDISIRLMENAVCHGSHMVFLQGLDPQKFREQAFAYTFPRFLRGPSNTVAELCLKLVTLCACTGDPKKFNIVRDELVKEVIANPTLWLSFHGPDVVFRSQDAEMLARIFDLGLAKGAAQTAINWLRTNKPHFYNTSPAFGTVLNTFAEISLKDYDEHHRELGDPSFDTAYQLVADPTDIAKQFVFLHTLAIPWRNHMLAADISEIYQQADKLGKNLYVFLQKPNFPGVVQHLEKAGFHSDP